MKIKKKYQINETFLMKKIRDVLLAKSKLNQQNRNYERKIHKQQVQELNQKLQKITQAIEMLKTPNS